MCPSRAGCTVGAAEGIIVNQLPVPEVIMDLLFFAAILLLFVMLLVYSSRTNRLASEVERLKRALGDQGAELNRVLELLGPVCKSCQSR